MNFVGNCRPLAVSGKKLPACGLGRTLYGRGAFAGRRRRGKRSDLGRCSGRTLGFFEEALGRLGPRGLILTSRLLLGAPPLALTGCLAPSGVRLLGAGLDAVAGRKTNLELDDFVPDCVRALVVGYRQKLTQAPTGILWLRFVACRFGRHFLDGNCFGGCLLGGLLFVHLSIIARIVGRIPVLPFVPDAICAFSRHRRRMVSLPSMRIKMLPEGDQGTQPAEAGGKTQQQG